MEESRRVSLSPRKTTSGSPPRSRFSLNLSKLKKDPGRDSSFDKALKKSIACLSPRSDCKKHDNTPISPRKKANRVLGKLTMQLLVDHATDKRVHSMIQRFAFGLGSEGLSLLSMVEFIGAYKAWRKKPTVDGAIAVVETYLGCDQEAESGKICKRGLYPLSGSEVLKKACDAVAAAQLEMDKQVAGKLKDLKKAEKLRDKLNGEIDPNLFNDVFFEVYRQISVQHFAEERQSSEYLPESNVAGPLMHLFLPSEKKQFVENKEAKLFYKELEVKVLRNSVELIKAKLSEAELTALVINGMVKHLVIVPQGVKCFKNFVTRKSDQIARLLMAHGKEVRKEVNCLERSLLKIEAFRKERGATTENLERLEQLIHYALYRLTTGQCSENRGSDLSTLALPEPSKKIIARVEQEVRLRVEGARLGKHSYEREVTEKEREAFASIKEKDCWRHLTKDDRLNFPGEFRVDGKALSKKSLKDFQGALPDRIGKTVVAATSISALVLFGEELENNLCPALWNTKKQLRKKQDGVATNYDIFIGNDGAIEAVTTITYRVEFWPQANLPIQKVASFCLRLALHLDPTLKLQKLTITPSDLTFSNSVVLYALRLQVLEALQGIRSSKKKQ